MWEEVESLKQHVSLLEYLRRLNWNPHRVGCRQEFVGLCPLRRETHPSFYVNAAKNVFYCHGCGQGGDLIRFAQLYFDLPFRQTVARLKLELGRGPTSVPALLEEVAQFYQLQLHRYGEAVEYLSQRGLRDSGLLQRLGVGFAPGGCLRRHLTSLGHPLELLFEVGLVNREGRDSFCRRVVFPCHEQGQFTNLYGRSIGDAPAHRFLSRPKAGLYAWDTVSTFPTVILVEGLFDLAVLWQAGFSHTTTALGTNLTPAQFAQLSGRCDRQIYLAFDSDANHAGQRAAAGLARRLEEVGLTAYIVRLPDGHDPNSYFVAGATPADFARCLDQARRSNL